MRKAGNKANPTPQPYKVSFSTGKPSASAIPQPPKPALTTTIAAINERQDSLFKRPKAVKPVPESLDISLKRLAEPLTTLTDKRPKMLPESSKPIYEDQLISSISRDIDTYMSLEGERTAVGEMRKALGEGGCEESEMVRLVDEAGLEVRRVGVRVAEETLALLRLFSLKSEWSLLMTLSCISANP